MKRQEPPLRAATLADAEEVAEILSEAFADDAVLNWVLGGSAPIPTVFREFTRGVYLKRGFGHVDGMAATLWLPAGVKVSEPPLPGQLRVLGSLIRQSGFSGLWRVSKAGEVMHRHHPQTPHFYLFAVGVRAAGQGQGLGGRILRAGLEQVDAAGADAYLENSKARNTPLYERLGFEAARQPLPLGPGAPPLLPMFRPARGAG